jgi:hypothetical protein
LFTVVDRVVHAKVTAGAVNDNEWNNLAQKMQPFSEVVLEKTRTLKGNAIAKLISTADKQRLIKDMKQDYEPSMAISTLENVSEESFPKRVKEEM